MRGIDARRLAPEDPRRRGRCGSAARKREPKRRPRLIPEQERSAVRLIRGDCPDLLLPLPRWTREALVPLLGRRFGLGVSVSISRSALPLSAAGPLVVRGGGGSSVSLSCQSLNGSSRFAMVGASLRCSEASNSCAKQLRF